MFERDATPLYPTRWLRMEIEDNARAEQS